MLKKLLNFKGIQLSNIFILMMMLVGSINFAATNDELVAIDLAACSAGADNLNNEFCLAEANKKFFSIGAAEQYFLSLLDQGVPRNGKFRPTIATLAKQYQNNPIGTFRTTYTVTDGTCTDSTDLAVTVVPNPNAGIDNTNNVFCLKEVQQMIKSPQDAEALYKSFLESGVATNGMFNPTIDQIVQSYQSNPIGTFRTTYTVKNGQNCMDSAELAIKVIPNANAGNDNVNNELCQASTDAMFKSVTDVRNYYLSLLDIGVATDGIFSPTIETLAGAYINNPIGTFTTEYTVQNEACDDLTILSLKVLKTPNAGVDNLNNVFCFNDINSTLSNNQNATAYFMSLIGPNADSNGTFSPSINEIVTQFNINPARVFTTTYTVNSGDCIDAANLSVTIIPESYAGKDNTTAQLTRSEAQKKFFSIGAAEQYFLSLLGPGANRAGKFRPTIATLAKQYQNNPIGTFSTTYSVSGSGCSDSASLTLTIVEDANKAQASSKVQSSSTNSTSSLVVYNLSGGVVKTSNVDATETFNKNSSAFTDSNLNSGIYIYKLNNGNGVISTKKIIVE